VLRDNQFFGLIGTGNLCRQSLSILAFPITKRGCSLSLFLPDPQEPFNELRHAEAGTCCASNPPLGLTGLDRLMDLLCHCRL
jgi:hypothetical protein